MIRVEYIEKLLGRELQENEMGLVCDPEFTKRFTCLKQLFLDREYTIAYARFVELKTLEDISKQFNLTRERVRQICAQFAFKSCRHYPKSIMLGGVEAVKLPELELELNDLQNKIRESKVEIDRLIKKKQLIDIEPEDSNSMLLNGLIQKELDVSQRARNCLRHCFGANATLEDLTNTPIKEIYRIRNCGIKTAQEIIDKVHELGLEFKGEN